MFKGWAHWSLALAAVGLFFSQQVGAQTPSEIHRNMVIQVKKNLPLTRAEKPRTDYYLNSGKRAGVKPGMIYPVYRRAPIHDPYFHRSRGDLLVHVADLLVFHVETEVSVARLHALTDPETRPLLDEPAVMVGDAVDVSKGRRPAAASAGAKPLAPAQGSPAPSVSQGLRPDKAMEVLEAYQKAQAPRAQEQNLPEAEGSLFVEEEELSVPVELLQTF